MWVDFLAKVKADFSTCENAKLHLTLFTNKSVLNSVKIITHYLIFTSFIKLTQYMYLNTFEQVCNQFCHIMY